MTHAVFDVAFKVPVRVAVVVGAAGMTQPVWQFAACELHDIMQFVTVEVTGVESRMSLSVGLQTFCGHYSCMYVRGELYPSIFLCLALHGWRVRSFDLLF